MLTAINRHGTKTTAALSEKQDGVFHCPICQQPVVLHKGMVKAHHFAHKTDSECEYRGNESADHIRAKQAIYDYFAQYPVVEVELEKPLDGVRPDVWIYAPQSKKTLAVEVQISNLTMEKIVERTRRYNALGICVFWLPVVTQELLAEKYAPRQWEKWLHALNFGKIFYWYKNANVIQVHFADYYLNKSHWDSDSHYSYEYEEKSKRWRKPIVDGELTIGSDFKPQRRAAWNSKRIAIPTAEILVPSIEPRRVKTL